MKRVVALALATACLAACASSKPGTDYAGSAVNAGTPTASPSTLDTLATDGDTGLPEPQGATAAQFGVAANVTSQGADAGTYTISTPKSYTREPGEFGTKPDNGRYLVYTIVAQADAAGSSTWSVNPFDFFVRDGDGVRYDPAYLSNVGAEFHSAELNPGEKIKGTMSFDVPAKGEMTLAYAPNGQAIAEWKS